ncbi:hypothetical protein EV178_005732 [Coemansia sp. RSA 1646]|nr:hypothetical protein EV178_005732 [Coemansia sp. RSA 1646]
MVQFHTYGSTSSKYMDIFKYSGFLLQATCYVPPALERSGKLTYRDRRHLGNVRILGWHGISHPGLTWHYSANLNSMTCLGYSCQIYQDFDPSQPNSCLSVHRSCYTVLLEHLERTEGTAGGSGLMQRVAPFADRRGIVSIPRPGVAGRKGKRHSSNGIVDGISWNGEDMFQDADVAAKMPWLVCDPTDLPTVAASQYYSRSSSIGSSFGGLLEKQQNKCTAPRSLSDRRGAPPPLLLHREISVESDDDDDFVCSTIPAQLLTPPTSPIDECNTQPHFHMPPATVRSNATAVCKPSVLLSLPPHVLLNVISHLHLPSLLVLSQTCSALRKYLSSDSKVWSVMSRSTLSFTPAFLYNQQFAEFYMRVRGNSRLENQVLLQRERVEKIVSYIMYSQKASASPRNIGYY